MAQTLLNKIALSSFQFKSVNALLAFQCLFCVLAVQLCSLLGLVSKEQFNLGIVRVWLPVNFIFVGMIGSSFWALKSLNVAMVTGAVASDSGTTTLHGGSGTGCSAGRKESTLHLLSDAAVLKNLTSIFVMAGDWYFYGRTYNLAVWGCVGLMLLSAICGGITDLSFDAKGYFWQIVNCGFTAAYSLYLRGAMDRVAEYTSTGKKLDEFSMVRPAHLWVMWTPAHVLQLDTGPSPAPAPAPAART